MHAAVHAKPWTFDNLISALHQLTVTVPALATFRTPAMHTMTLMIDIV
jgi:hypothetical protein